MAYRAEQNMAYRAEQDMAYRAGQDMAYRVRQVMAYRADQDMALQTGQDMAYRTGRDSHSPRTNRHGGSSFKTSKPNEMTEVENYEQRGADDKRKIAQLELELAREKASNKVYQDKEACYEREITNLETELEKTRSMLQVSQDREAIRNSQVANFRDEQEKGRSLIANLTNELEVVKDLNQALISALEKQKGSSTSPSASAKTPSECHQSEDDESSDDDDNEQSSDHSESSFRQETTAEATAPNPRTENDWNRSLPSGLLRRNIKKEVQQSEPIPGLFNMLLQPPRFVTAEYNEETRPRTFYRGNGNGYRGNTHMRRNYQNQTHDDDATNSTMHGRARNRSRSPYPRNEYNQRNNWRY